MEFLDKYDKTLPNLPKSYGRSCCICGKDVTYSRGGTPVWYRYKDEKGNFTGEWKCHNCNVRRKGHKFRQTLKCRLCGSDKTRIQSNNKPIWVRDLDINKEFTGKYLCYKCYYQVEKKCYKCGKTNGINKEYIDEHWTGRFMCHNCRTGYIIGHCSFCGKEIKRSFYARLDDIRKICSACLPKITADRRNKNLNPDSPTEIGYITEILVAKFLDIKTCFDITNFNYRSFDIYEHEDYGRINVKGASLTNNGWYFHVNRKTVTSFFVLDSIKIENIKRVYIIPNDVHISNNVHIYININDIDYEFFREDERPWDDLFHTLKLDECPVLRNR